MTYPYKALPDREAVKEAARLAEVQGRIVVESKPELELQVSIGDDGIVSCNVWKGGEEQHGGLLDVDLSTEPWREI